MISKPPPQQTRESILDAREYAEQALASISAKADRNENLSRRLSILFMVLPVIPAVLILFDESILRNVSIALVSIALAGIAGYWKFEVPTSRWKLYRRYQRLIESELTRFEGKVGEYGSGDSSQTLRLRILDLLRDLHDDWERVVGDELPARSGG